MTVSSEGSGIVRSMVDRDFGNWLAGFIDGEGCFYITRDNSRAVRRPRFSLTVRSDDRPILEEIVHRTGIGTLHNYFAQSGAQVSRWMVNSRADCDALIELLDQHPLRAKKQRDFQLWKEGVEVTRGIKKGRAPNDDIRVQIDAIRERLQAIRQEGVVYA